ncbi:MAG TPA: HDIG domain-containing protein [Candidatus Omnitrophota bacterium]|nr:HDIG domain-containing protein [Candidatus Omnitrophota bacterium]HQJ15272.1 HDIG domain-containing protein [Candidatus Omnitrophota bacterium]
MDFIKQACYPYRNVFRRIYAYAVSNNAKLYLVGGFLRDIYLGRHRQDPDIDFCMARGAVRFGRGLAKHLKCGFVVLDELHGCCRLVQRCGKVICTVDIADFRSPEIAEDLALRDFSVNSICLSLADLIEKKEPAGYIIDPYGGRLDIKRRRLRIMYRGAFEDDPVRLLRAFSLSALYGFVIDPECMARIVRSRKRLKDVSPERVRDEMFKIFESGRSAACLRALDSRGILEIVFPEIRAMKRVRKAGRARIDIWQHTIDTVVELEGLCSRLTRNADVRGYLGERLSGGRSVYALLKAAALLHDAGKPATFRFEKGKVSFYGHERAGSRMAADIARRLKLSNEEQRWLSKVAFLHLRPGYMATMRAVTERAVFRFFRDAGRESIAILLLALADERATSGYQAVEKIRPRYERLISRLMRLYFERQKKTPRRRLVTGHDIMRLGSIPPSRSVGELLRQAEEAIAVKGITQRAEALECVRKLIKDRKRHKEGRWRR